MINEEQALAIINKYSPTTKLTIRNEEGRVRHDRAFADMFTKLVSEVYELKGK